MTANTYKFQALIHLLFLFAILGWSTVGLSADKLPFKFGMYELLNQEDSQVCPYGNFQLVDGGQVLILGPNVSFSNLTGGIQKERPEFDGCAYEIETTLKDQTLTKITTISLCPETEFNNVILQSLTQVSEDHLEYHLQSKSEDGPIDLKCQLNKIKE